MRRLLPLLVCSLLLAGSEPLAPVAPQPPPDCFGPGGPGAGVRFQLLADDGGDNQLFHGRRPDGSGLLVRVVSQAPRDAEPRCELWGIGEVMASVDARMVGDAAERQTVTLHDSDVPGLTGVVVVRDAEKGLVLAAGPFFLFCPVTRLERVDLGQGFDLVSMGCVRPDARRTDEHGVGWHDAGQHLLVASGAVVQEVVKSVALAPRWTDAQGRRCEATPDVALEIVEAGLTPRVRGLDAPDVPGWGARLLRGQPFDVELGAYTWRWSADHAAFLVEAPGRRERVGWRVEPRCE